TVELAFAPSLGTSCPGYAKSTLNQVAPKKLRTTAANATMTTRSTYVDSIARFPRRDRYSVEARPDVRFPLARGLPVGRHPEEQPREGGHHRRPLDCPPQKGPPYPGEWRLHSPPRLRSKGRSTLRLARERPLWVKRRRDATKEFYVRSRGCRFF